MLFLVESMDIVYLKFLFVWCEREYLLQRIKSQNADDQLDDIPEARMLKELICGRMLKVNLRNKV